ncbi:MAG: citrate/2-methylcitrate synthase [Bacteroidota bacterium]
MNMNRYSLLLCAFFLLFSVSATAQVEWLSWEEAVARNEKAPRKFLVDVYTDWCGWCKKMDKQVFTDPKIEAYLKENFYAVKLNAEQRATIQYDLGEELCPDDPIFRTAAVLRRAAVKVLSENPKISNPHPNVDAVSGSLLQAGGLTDANYYTNLFGLARITGIAAQIVDERVNARNGRGVPIYRPKYVFSAE